MSGRTRRRTGRRRISRSELQLIVGLLGVGLLTLAAYWWVS